MRREVIGVQPSVDEELLQGPKGKLGIVGRNADWPVVGILVAEIVAYLATYAAPVTRELALGGVPQGIADSQPDHHTLYPTPIEPTRQRRGNSVEKGAAHQFRLLPSIELVKHRLVVHSSPSDVTTTFQP